jgi:acyl carrier protein
MPESQPVLSPTDKSSIVESLRVIWRDALRQDQLATNQTFLDLGGDSMSAMLCNFRIYDQFKLEFELENFLSGESSIDNFAELIWQAQSKGQQEIQEPTST